MARELFITPKDVVAFAPMETISDDRILPMIVLAQEKYTRNDLGKALYDQVVSELASDDPESANINTLRLEYIKPALVWLTFVEILEWNDLRIDDKGNYTVAAENGTTANDQRISRARRNARINAQTYSEQLIDYLCYNSELYPNYYRTTDGGPYPSFRAFSGGWYLN